MKNMMPMKSDRVLDFQETAEALKEQRSTRLLPKTCTQTIQQFQEAYNEAPADDKKQLTRTFAQAIVYVALRASEQTSTFKVEQIADLSEKMVNSLLETTEGKYIPPHVGDRFKKAANNLNASKHVMAVEKQASKKLFKCAHKITK